MIEPTPQDERATGEASRMGFRRSFPKRLIGAIRLDASLYAEVEHDPSAIFQAALIVGMAGLARGLAAVATGDPVGLVASLVIAFISWAVVTILLWFVGVVLDHDTSTLFELFRTVGFAASPLILLCLAAIPVISSPPVVLAIQSVTHVAAAVALFVAAREALDVSTLRAIVICGSVILVLALALAYVINIVAARLQGVIDVVVSAASQT